jgi:hypothetical protein
MKHGFIVVMIVSGLSARASAQTPASRSARDMAPVDFTGNWVSIVTEDYRWRMVTPLYP